MHTSLLSQFNCLKNKASFTIVEALTAVIILGICAAVLFSSLHLSFNLINYIRESIIASSILQEEMEELRKTNFANLPPPGESAFSNNSLSSLYNASGTIKVDQYIDTNILRIVITVTWDSRLKAGKQYTKYIATLITKNGINSI